MLGAGVRTPPNSRIDQASYSLALRVRPIANVVLILVGFGDQVARPHRLPPHGVCAATQPFLDSAAKRSIFRPEGATDRAGRTTPGTDNTPTGTTAQRPTTTRPGGRRGPQRGATERGELASHAERPRAGGASRVAAATTAPPPSASVRLLIFRGALATRHHQISSSEDAQAVRGEISGGGVGPERRGTPRECWVCVH